MILDGVVLDSKTNKGAIIIELQPRNFTPEQTTIWSFPDRGKWATHSGKYRGNWSPYVPRNLMLRYSKPGDWVLDQFSGSGTTLVEAKLLNRNAIGVDVNPKSVDLSKENLDFECETSSRIVVRNGDVRTLSFIRDESIDFICTHPPYADIIKYSDNIGADLSLFNEQDFLEAIDEVAKEAHRVLKHGKCCAVMMGDKRRKGNVVPLGFQVMNTFLDAGFKSKEIIIKEQHNCRSTSKWTNIERDFLLLEHEYIFVFYK